MRELLLRGIKVVKVHNILKMEIGIKENMLMGNLMEKEIITGIMVQLIRDSLEMEREMVREYGSRQVFLLMCMKENTWMI